MLVFTRKRNETIMIGDGIEVRVLRIGKDGVRLGITAPASVPVHRREVYDQIREENQRAARAPAPAAGTLGARVKLPAAAPAAEGRRNVV
ncbi:MAG: carbon storage regulator CsrA [Vicinamibacterales bacterium]|nr:carbon storage regulator CsrA [Vicinamibacterales bacterium]